MGCICSSKAKEDGGAKRFRKPGPFNHTERITRAELIRLRNEFWDTAPHYGGRKEIWDALKAAAESDDISYARAIVEGAGIIVETDDLTICYDERGARYELPKYVLDEPANLIRN